MRGSGIQSHGITGEYWIAAFAAMTVAWRIGAAPSQHLPRIEDALRIERALQRLHQLVGDRVLDLRQVVALDDADAVLGGNRAAVFQHDPVDGVVHLVPTLEVLGFVGADRLGDVVVNVAVADVAEWHWPAAGNELARRGVAFLDERRDVGDRHRDVVLDRAALAALHLAEQLADAPERPGLLDAFADGGVEHQALLQPRGQNLLHRLAQPLAPL